MCPDRHLVDQASENLFSHSALAQQQNGNIHLRHQRHLGANLLHLGACGEEEKIVFEAFDFNVVGDGVALQVRAALGWLFRFETTL